MFNKMQFINEFNKMYLARLNKNKDKLIEAFVIYYGEMFRDVIVKQYEKIIFCWFTHDKISEYYNDYICPNILKNRIEMTQTILEKLGYSLEETQGQNKNFLNTLLYFLFGKEQLFDFQYESSPIYNFFSFDYHRQQKIVKKVFGQKKITPDILERIHDVILYMDFLRSKQIDEKKYINFYLFDQCLHPDYDGNLFMKLYHKLYKEDIFVKPQVIGASNPLLFDSIFKRELEDINNTVSQFGLPHQRTLSQNFSVVALPVLISSDENVIHEINHSILSLMVAIYMNDKSFINISKNGIYMADGSSNEHSKLFEELLNERSAIDITKIFHELGGNIFDQDDYQLPLKSLYEVFLPLFETFYQKYLSVLKIASITENGNLLHQAVDKKILEEYKIFLWQNFSDFKVKVFDKDKKNFIFEEPSLDNQIEIADDFVRRMEKPFLEPISLEQYIEELEKKGHRVRILNHN